MGSDGRSWMMRSRPNPGASTRLYCFPHAGGGASSFHGWGRILTEAEVCAIQYPGRENRLFEPAHVTLEALVADLIARVAPALVAPYVLFGHSMGAAVAFAFASALRETRFPGPELLVVSARRAPNVAPREQLASTLSDAELLQWMRMLGSISDEHLENAELMALVLPVLRADLALLDGATFADATPLGCPIHAFSGDADGFVTANDLEGWRAFTRGDFRKTMLPGGHFYFRDPGTRFFEHLEDLLATVAR